MEHPVPSVKEFKNDSDDDPYMPSYEMRINPFSSPIKPQFYSNSISNITLDMQYDRVNKLLVKYDRVCNLKKNKE